MISHGEQLPGRRIGQGERFCFRCHSGLACFNSCCRAKRLQLMPYDVLRLRRGLALSSEQLLGSQVELELEPTTGWPWLRIRLLDDGRCPWLTPTGCGVYADRPTCCRIYPLARATRLTAQGLEEVFLAEESPACLGWAEPRQLGTEEWIAEQGLDPYFTANQAFMALLLQRPRDGLSERQVHAIVLGLYNLDVFRQTMPSLEGRPALDGATLEAASRSDEALLAIGLRWVAAELGALAPL